MSKSRASFLFLILFLILPLSGLADLVVGGQDAEGAVGSNLTALFQREIARVTTVNCDDTGPILDLASPLTPPREETALDEVAIDRIRSLRLLGHANAPLKVLMVCTPTTQDEVQGTFEAIKDINEALNLPADRRLKLHVIPAGESALKGLRIHPKDVKVYLEVNRYFATRDIWMQDWGEIASVRVEGADKERLVVFDSNRGRGLADLPERLAKMWSGHYVLNPEKAHACGNYGGNIEVTPDDILVIGDTSTEATRDFFARAGYADRMVVLETSWLTVGHVDEYVNTVATPDSELGYSILKADPRLALELIRAEEPPAFEDSLGAFLAAYHENFARFPASFGQDRDRLEKVFVELGLLNRHLRGETGETYADSAKLASFNEEMAVIIDRNVQTLKEAIRTRNGPGVSIEVVSLPTLFGKEGGRACAMLPGVINMIVLYDHMIVPDPLLPSFRNAVSDGVGRLGYTPHFVANPSYHFYQGQLHCGTNVFRHPNRFVHPRYETLKRSATFHAIHRPN